MKGTYQKPVVIPNDAVSEGVFAASGAIDGEDVCYITAWHNSEQDGIWGGHYKFQIGWTHSNQEHAVNNNGHNILGDVITLTFDREVTFFDVWGDLVVVDGDGTNVIKLKVTSEGAGNRVSDIHVDCSTQPTLLSVKVEHGN